MNHNPSLGHEPGIEQWSPRPFRVTIEDDDGGRASFIVDAIGRNDARNLGRERALDLGYPGPAVIDIQEAA